MSAKRYLCIHGHFYQPPRENPWLEAVELQESAYPYHDWNGRICAECYAPNTASRILDDEKMIVQIVNNYAKISFNFGPTLLSWMAENEPDVYAGILAADKESRKRFSGHGAALAQGFNHMILPLANRRDKETQIRWGLKDFESRFGRMPEGMWLPETAVDLETLDLLVEAGIKFTILAPRQAKAVRRIGGRNWIDVSGGRINPRRPYRCTLPSGKKIAIFFYDGPISQAIAFEGLLTSGETLAQRLMRAFTNDAENQLVHIATDGETYGHHHKMGDMALAYCLHYIDEQPDVELTNYGYFLERFSPTHEVTIFENSSWSCVHGIERWRNNCGCHTGMHAGWTQNWRGPLRRALDALRDKMIAVYEKEMAAFVEDPWQTRDDYILVILDRRPDRVEKFLAAHAKRSLSRDDQIKVLKLLEMQRHAMLMYTSCGWFFDEISGIETAQILQYAARAIQLAEEFSPVPLEEDFIAELKKAPSNIPAFQDGAYFYETKIRPTRLDLTRVGAHYAVSSLFEEYATSTSVYSYTAEGQLYDRLELGKQKFAVGKAVIRSQITWEAELIGFAVIHLGDHHLVGGVSSHMEEKTFSRMHQTIRDLFRRNDVSAAVRAMGQYFRDGQYSLKHLFRDEQSKVLLQILDSTLEDMEVSLRRLNEHHYPIIQVIRQLHIPLPNILSHTVLVMLNTDLLRVLGDEIPDARRLEELVTEAREWSLEIDKVTVEFVVKRRLTDLMGSLQKAPSEIRCLEGIESILRILTPLHLNLDLWKAQNIYFALGQDVYGEEMKKAEAGDGQAKKWVDLFGQVGRYLRVRVKPYVANPLVTIDASI